MVGIAALPTLVQALLIVAIVVVEAVVLYVGYGYLESLFGSRILETIVNN